MNYPTPLLTGRLIKRYKRFFADIEHNGETVVAHVPNTGSLKTVCDQGPATCRFSKNDNPERKLKFTLEQVYVQNKDAWVGVHTHRANQLALEVIQSHFLPHWAGHHDITREYKINANTRLDFLLRSPSHRHFIEVKSVSMALQDVALFPDAVTTRGQKHIQELVGLIDKNTSCEILFLVQRNDVKKFSPATNIDPEYTRLLRWAIDNGLKATALPCALSDEKIEPKNKLLEIVL